MPKPLNPKYYNKVRGKSFPLTGMQRAARRADPVALSGMVEVSNAAEDKTGEILVDNCTDSAIKTSPFFYVLFLLEHYTREKKTFDKIINLYLCLMVMRPAFKEMPRYKRHIRIACNLLEEKNPNFFSSVIIKPRSIEGPERAMLFRARKYFLYLKYIIEKKDALQLHQFFQNLLDTFVSDFYNLPKKEKARFRSWAKNIKLLELSLTYYQSGELRSGDDSEEKLEDAARVVHLLAKSLGVEVGDYQVDVIYQSAIEKAEKFYEKEVIRLASTRG